MTRSQLLDVENLDDNFAALQDLAGFLEGQDKNFNMITLKDLDKVKGTAQDAQGKLLGPGKMATLTATPGGLRLTQYAEDDSLVAAKPGEISYGGDAASKSGIGGIFGSLFPSLSNFALTPADLGMPSEIKIYMQVDGNNIAEAALDSGLLFKATQQKNGRYTLPGNVVVDASGNSVERTGQ